MEIPDRRGMDSKVSVLLRFFLCHICYNNYIERFPDFCRRSHRRVSFNVDLKARG